MDRLSNGLAGDVLVFDAVAKRPVPETGQIKSATPLDVVDQVGLVELGFSRAG